MVSVAWALRPVGVFQESVGRLLITEERYPGRNGVCVADFCPPTTRGLCTARSHGLATRCLIPLLDSITIMQVLASVF